jgi:nucleoside 2-deoxyribosyltransferase
MSYSLDKFEAIKQTIIKSALAAGFEAEVSIDLKTPGSITDQIWHGIRRSDVVVVDVTNDNPNVFYELGLAHALGKEVIVISQDVTKVPFDIKTSRLLSYDPADLSRLETDLTNAFKSVTARYKYEGPEPRF